VTHADFQLGHLANFFFQRHPREKFLDGCGRSACRRARWSQISPQKRLAINDPRRGVIGAGRYRHYHANSQLQ